MRSDRRAASPPPLRWSGLLLHPFGERLTVAPMSMEIVARSTLADIHDTLWLVQVDGSVGLASRHGADSHHLGTGEWWGLAHDPAHRQSAWNVADRAAIAAGLRHTDPRCAAVVRAALAGARWRLWDLIEEVRYLGYAAP